MNHFCTDNDLYMVFLIVDIKHNLKDGILIIFFPALGCWITSATAGGILDRAIEAEDKKHGDFLRLVMIFFFLAILFDQNMTFILLILEKQLSPGI